MGTRCFKISGGPSLSKSNFSTSPGSGAGKTEIKVYHIADGEAVDFFNPDNNLWTHTLLSLLQTIIHCLISWAQLGYI